ncbi:hypothetical protein MMC15_004573 [Xylographa vitiligo]|nr:hypothetical protein [Xylographa vitiligo]
MASSSKPVFVLVPGAAQNPSHYAYLQHLLLSQGYGVLSALLPTVGATAPLTAEDDAEYIRSRMLLPVLDLEKHDVVMISHSYSGMPASAAARGLGKADRVAEGKETSVLGQIFIASMLPRGGDGKDVIATFGGQMPPHIQVDEAENLIKCADPIPPLYQDVSPTLAESAVLSCISHGLTAFKSPCPAATWDEEAFKGRCAYIRTLHDRAVPYEVQNMIIQATGQEWITKDIETGHCPQLAAPEKLSSIILELAKHFEAM